MRATSRTYTSEGFQDLGRPRPRVDAPEEMLQPIPGSPPSLINRPPGCPFHTRCFLSQGRAQCRTEEPPLRTIDAPTHLTACHFAEELRDAAIAPAGVLAGGTT